jgi:hypothetical protein
MPVKVPIRAGISMKTIPNTIPETAPNIPDLFFPPNGLSIPKKPSVIKIAPIACCAAANVAGLCCL